MYNNRRNSFRKPINDYEIAKVINEEKDIKIAARTGGYMEICNKCTIGMKRVAN